MTNTEIINIINKDYIKQSSFKASNTYNYFSPKNSTSLLMLSVCFISELPIEYQEKDFFIYDMYKTHYFKVKNYLAIKELLIEMDALNEKTDDKIEQLFYDKNISLDKEVFLKVNFFGGI